MEEDSLDDLKGITIQDLLNDTNPSFYNLLKKALNLNRIRAIELCTYLLNYQIQSNYFPSFKTLMK